MVKVMAEGGKIGPVLSNRPKLSKIVDQEDEALPDGLRSLRYSLAGSFAD